MRLRKIRNEIFKQYIVDVIYAREMRDALEFVQNHRESFRRTNVQDRLEDGVELLFEDLT